MNSSTVRSVKRKSDMSSSNKIVLGTAQFGLQYGVNSAGRPAESVVRDILAEALEGGITTLDTSSAYGNAEEILGRCMPVGAPFCIVSKYPKGSGPVRDCFEASLARLGVKGLYGYLLHHFELFRDNPALWEDFVALKESGRVQKIGFSLYMPEELDFILDAGVPFDLLQVPFNLFDRKFLPYMEELHGRGVEIHVRSTFLQGLFFKDREALPPRLQPLRKYLLQLDDYARESGLGISEIALNHNLQNPYVDGVLMGVDNVAQLHSDLQSVVDTPIDLEVEVAEQELLNPVNWN